MIKSNEILTNITTIVFLLIGIILSWLINKIDVDLVKEILFDYKIQINDISRDLTEIELLYSYYKGYDYFGTSVSPVMNDVSNVITDTPCILFLSPSGFTIDRKVNAKICGFEDDFIFSLPDQVVPNFDSRILGDSTPRDNPYHFVRLSRRALSDIEIYLTDNSYLSITSDNQRLPQVCLKNPFGVNKCEDINNVVNRKIEDSEQSFDVISFLRIYNSKNLFLEEMKFMDDSRSFILLFLTLFLLLITAPMNVFLSIVLPRLLNF